MASGVRFPPQAQKNKLKNYMNIKEQKGFTLIELIFVLIIISTLITILITIIKPNRIFMHLRDSQRIADLNNLNRAIEIYINDTLSKGQELVLTSSGTLAYFFVGGDILSPKPNFNCAGFYGSGPDGTIFFSTPTVTPNSIDSSSLFYYIADKNLHIYSINYNTFRATNSKKVANSINTNDYGWLPVPLSLSKSVNINYLPIDPINTKSNNVISEDHYYYTFACAFIGSNIFYEINTNLEIKNEEEKNDGGTAPDLYEVGSDLRLLPYKINGYFKYSP
ncbi:MAG: prepilin-type N-terminal cleavage/methylation domain-containing protein [Patescibacteria group bacterium]|nr:prepilin-type N-terminal cleavage/methylation domain-containing protein [Patescibacteria group bacterium]